MGGGACRSAVPVFPLFEAFCNRTTAEGPHEDPWSVHSTLFSIKTSSTNIVAGDVGSYAIINGFVCLFVCLRAVNHYKCPLCDMTCPSPSSLRNHIKFRHSNERPYSCEYCEYRYHYYYLISSISRWPWNQLT